MNEQVLKDLYVRAQSLGYTKGIEDFRTLIQTDQRVQDDNFAYVQSKGYKKSKEEFFGLLGMNQSTSTIPLKKKESAQSTESLSDDGSLAQSLPEATKKTLSKVGIEPQPTPKEDPLRFNQMPPQMQVEEAFKIIQGKGYQGTKEDFIAEYGIQVPQTQEEEYRNKDIFGQNIRNAYSGALRYSPQKKEVVAPAKAEPTPMEQSKEQFAEQFPKTIERIKQAPEEARQAGEYLETVRKGEREAELAQMQDNQQDEEFLRLVSGVDNLYIKAASEDKAERELNERFKKYGIVFAQSKAGHDVLIARTADGKKSIEIPLAASTADSNSKRLRDFIIQNGKAQTESMSEDFITKSLRAQNMRRVGRLNKDGSASTVEFMSFEQDGKFIVAPTLFPKDKLNYGADPRGWMKLEPAKAIEEARGRGELFEFKTKEEAERFAKGAWKDVTMSDLEGQKFFQERGLDYFDYKNRRDELLSIDKEQALIENTSAAIKSGEITNAKQYFSKKLSPEEAIKYSYLLNGNNLRPDLESYVQKRQQQKNELYAQVEDRTFFNDGKAQTTFEDFDVYLNKKSDESKKKAEETNKIAKQKYEELNAVSLEAFGIPATQLMTYKPKTQDEVNVINDIKQRMSAVVELQKVAAERYYASSTFFDSKLNKAARNEYDENMAAWWSEFNSAWARGEAGAQLMKTIMGVNSVEEAGQLISEAMQDAEGGTRSRAFQTYMSSGALLAGDERAAKAFWSDPFEITANLVATSLAQLLPIGLRIVPATTLAGAGIGGGISAATTGGLGTPGGIISGAKYGLQTGVEMANFNMEYTNSFFEAAQERGYDVKDPEQFVKAWDDDAVWNQTNNIGIRRGLAIGAVGLMSSSLAGRVFKVSKLASKAQKVGTFVAERAVFDPLMEGAGELLAQEWSTGTYDLKEIEGEMMGGIGNNAISAGFNIATSSLKNTNIDYANTLTDISAVAEESASDERISNWAANMRRLGQIDAETEQRIQRNVGLRRESKDLLSVGDNGKLASRDSKLQARMMELMAARDEMSSTNNRREVYRNYIAQVNEELREIAETKKLRAPENAVNLSTMNAPTSAPGMPKYSINGRSMTKENFMDSVAKMSKSRYMRSRIVVDNDDTTIGQLNQKLIDKGFIAKPKTDAVQEQSTAQLSPQVSAAVGEGVGEQVPGQEEVAGEVEQERLREETQQQVEQSRGRLSELEDAIPAVMEVTPEVLVQATNNELAPEQLDGVLSSIADDIISETELSPEQDALVSANKARVDELVSLKSEQEALSSEVNDLESMLSQSGGFQFRAEEGVTTQRDADWDSKAKAELPASSFESDEAFQSTVRDGQWGMLTAENPDAIQVSDAENEAANKRAEEWLRSRGYNPQRIFGKYGNSENSFFVEGLTTEDAVEFAREFSQESVATDKGLVYQDGKMNPRQKGQETFAAADDFYSTIKIGDNLSDFSVSYDFDEKTESGVKPAPKAEGKTAVEGDNPLQDVESTTKALEGVDEKEIEQKILPKTVDVYKIQDDGAERILERSFKPNRVWVYKIENAGDIIRELSKYKNQFLDPSYIYEKVNKIEKFLKEQQNQFQVHPEDSYFQFKRQNEESVKDFISAYENLPTISEAQSVAKKMVLDLLNGNIDEAQKGIDYFNEIRKADDIKAELQKRNKYQISEAYHKAKEAGNNPELVKAVEDLLGAPKAGPQTRIDTKLEQVQEIDENAELERIVGEMNELDSPLVDTSAQIESTEGASIDVEELNSRLDTPLDVVNIQILDGVPVLVTISDQLVASNDGVIDNVTGKKITNLFGGLGFNGIKKFLKAAWANINEDEAKNQHKKALEIYKNNKAIIEKFWADNPKYDGHVPMLVVKMGENSILSNEAVSRVLVERIKSLNVSKENKKKAFSNLQERLKVFVENYKKEKAAVDKKNAKLKEGEKKKAISASTKNPYNLAKFISENNIKDFDGVLNSIAQMPISARGVINKLLTSGSIRKPGETSKKPGGPGKDSIAKILLGDNKNNSLLSIQSITDVLTEPSTSNIPIGSVISVVGVKVAEKQADGTYKEAGRAIKVDHPNYEYGAEGMSFGVVKNPTTIQSIMPDAYDAVVSKNIEKVKEKKKPIGTSLAIGIGQGLKGLVGRTISTNPPKMMALISLINKAFPNVSVYTTTEAFNRILQNTDTKLTMKGDAVLYGVTANGDIYINPEVHNTESELFNTIIHEFGHVWLNMLLTSPEGSKGRKLYQQGINIIREGIKTDPKLKALYDSQMKLFNNNEADAINEMLAILIGNRGEMISKASTDIRTKFNDFLLAMWEYVRATFKMSKDISVEEISNMSLDDFLGTAMADLLSGQDMKISDAQLTKMRNLTSMARQDDSMQSIIDLGRQNGFSDQSIKEILMRRGFKAADIDTAMEVRVDLMTELPDAFANVEGGVKEGMKLFADVRQQLSKYAKKKVKEADGTTRTRTMSEIRQKALELLKEHPIFKAQATITKDELILAFDRSMSTRANRGVDAQIAEIRKGLKSKKMGVKELAAAQKKLIDFVSSVLPQSKGYSVARIERIVRLIGSTNINNFDAQAERVMKIVEAQKDLMAKKDIADAVARQRQEMRDRRAGQKDLRSFQITLKNFIRTNLPKSKGYSQLMVNRLVSAVANTTTQNYVAQAVRVLNIVDKQRKLMSNQRISEIANVIVKSSRIAKTGSGKRRAGRVDADTQALFATMKQTMRALAMAQKGDSSMLDRISASVDPAILAGKGIDLDEVQQKIDNGEELTAAERDAFNTTVALQELGGIFSMSLEELDSLLERTKEMGIEGIARLKADKLVLSAEISSMKTQAEAQIKSDFGFLYDENGDLKTKNRLDSEFRQIWENFRKLKVWDGIKGWVQTIDFQSLTGFQDFMRKKIYHLGTLMNVLDKGGDFFKKNVYDVLNRMDEKSKRGFQIEMANLDSFARAFEFKNYKQFARSLNGPPVNINGKLLTIDQMMRVYALSKNPIQRNKLIDMGIDIDRIESFLTDEQRGFVDMVVDYLSNSYFDGVNSIYSYVNNVNLGYVENYFPTKTIQTKIDGNILESGDFGSVFNAETAPALKERTDTKGEIDLSSDFTAVLENHFRSMERYKAMAIGVRKMVQIFKMEDVKTLLERTGTKDMIMRGLNFAINPDSMTREPTTIVGKLSSKFTGFALSFKAIQILKQGSSFVQAFEDYTVRKGKPTPVLDHIMFMLDMAYIVATLPKQIKKAYDMSANVKERLDQGLEGDVYGLESGTGVFRPISKSSSAWAKARRAFQTGAAAPTVLGDIIGVLGYMAVYNRMIKQGFTHAEALEAFNSYNSTQQSRRATEKSPIQMSNNEFQRLFTMFGSTVFLQMNKIAQTSTNIMRSAKKGKMPKAKDVRGLMLNIAISNVLFVGAANIAKFIYGDDEDDEEALKAMRNAMLGLNVIYAIPIFGSALESMVAYAEGEPDRADDTINVFQNLFRKYKKAEEGLDDGNVWAAVQPLVEIVIGAQLDPFIGIYNYFGGDEDMQEDAAYDMLGITPSYRPSNDEKPVSTMGKEDMKRYFPDLYDETYGPNSPGYDIQQEINEMEKEIEKEQQQLKDEAYGYSE